MKVYVCSKSKAELNRRIVKNDEIICTEYNAYNPNGYITKYLLSDLENGTIIAIYKELIDGQLSPPHVWGTYLKEKNMVK